MRRSILISATLAAVALLHIPTTARGQHLHVNDRWDECSIQLSPSLTQSAWRQFAREAGLVTYFRPLSDARPLGKGHIQVSVVQWETRIDDADAAWNDTFVHPDATHELVDGRGLNFPGLIVRAGVSEKTDVAAYVTKNPRANYGFYGVQVQRAIAGSATSEWAAAGRASFVAMSGPEDLDFGVLGAELVASRTVVLARHASISPYAGISGYLARAHEKTAVVTLRDEHVPGVQATFGAVFQVSAAQVALEYNVAAVRSVSLRMGVKL